MRYNVGQVVFLLSKKDMKVFPAQVVEEIISKKLEGENVTYMARLPNKDRSEVSLSEINADVFKDARSLKQHMIKSATESITGLVSSAERLAERSFESAVTEDLPPLEIEPKPSGLAEVDLGNGIKAKLNLSDVPPDLAI